MEVDNYMVKYKDIKANKITWVELNAKIYNFCLQHSPPDLESVLKVNSIWDKTMSDQDGIGLLHMIQYITHKQYENMQSMIAYVKAFLEFSTTYQEPNQFITDYYDMFKSRRDTVTVHGGQPGYHLKLYAKNWNKLMVTEIIVDEQVIDTEKLD